MTHILKTAQDVVDHFASQGVHYRSRASLAEGEKNAPESPPHLRGKALAMQEVVDYLSDLYLGEVKFTDIKEVTYKDPVGEKAHPDWYHRLNKERQQLLHKVEALAEFVYKGMPGVETELERMLLIQQLTAMEGYIHILHIRWRLAMDKRKAQDAIPVDSSGMRDSHT